MPPALFTFHQILSACEAGSREGWRAFLSDYTPLAFELFGLYLPSCREPFRDFWLQSLGELAADNLKGLRKFERQSEPEFLADLRAFLLERGAATLDPAGDSTVAPRLTLESVRELLKGLPLVHQEVVFLKLAGFSDATLEKILVITPAAARKGLERLGPENGALLGRSEDRCSWPAAWAELTRQARAAKQEACPPLRQFVRIHEGAFSWYDKEPAEQHVTGCLHCLERWAGLREVKYWRRQAAPRPAAEIDGFLSVLPVRTASAPRKSFLARMFG
jgi:hypothetical protein